MLYYLRLDPDALNGKTLLEGCDSCLVAAADSDDATAQAHAAFPGTSAEMWEDAEIIEMGDNVVAANGGVLRFKSTTLTPYPLEAPGE